MVFRLTRGTVERLIQACGNHEPRYFGNNLTNCAAGKPGISIKVKVLGVLKATSRKDNLTYFNYYDIFFPAISSLTSSILTYHIID
jgi:hypothetical protein